MKRAKTKARRRPPTPRVQVEDFKIEDTDWTPTALRVHPRGVKTVVMSGRDEVAVSITEWGRNATRDPSAVLLAVSTKDAAGKYNDGEFCDPIKVGHLDALIEALVVARDRGREVGILPRGAS